MGKGLFWVLVGFFFFFPSGTSKSFLIIWKNIPKQRQSASARSSVPPLGTCFLSHVITANRMSPKLRSPAWKDTSLLCMAMNTKFPLGCQEVEGFFICVSKQQSDFMKPTYRRFFPTSSKFFTITNISGQGTEATPFKIVPFYSKQFLLRKTTYTGYF